MLVVPGEGIILPHEVPKQRNFDNFLGAYIDYTRDQEASRKIHLWTCLSIMAGVLGRKVWLPRDHYDTYPNLFVVIVGAPGLVKKSTATGIGVDLLRDIPGFALSPEQTTDASLVDALKRSERKYLVSGKEQRHSSLYVYGSELANMFKSSYGEIAIMLTDFYDCKPRDTSKAWVRESRAGGKIEIFGTCLNMLGCTTPRWLKYIVSSEEMDGGFASRINFVIANDKPEKFNAIPDSGVQNMDMRKKLVEDLMYMSTLSGPMTMDSEARELFKQIYVANQNYIYDNQDDSRFSGYYGRKPMMIEKIAMIFSACERDDRVITHDHIAFAKKEIEEIEKVMLEKFQHVGRNELSEITQKVLSFIRLHKRVTSAEVLMRFSADLNANDFSSVISQLRQMEMIRVDYNGGTPALAWIGRLAPPPEAEIQDVP